MVNIKIWAVEAYSKYCSCHTVWILFWIVYFLLEATVHRISKSEKHMSVKGVWLSRQTLIFIEVYEKKQKQNTWKISFPFVKGHYEIGLYIYILISSYGIWLVHGLATCYICIILMTVQAHFKLIWVGHFNIFSIYKYILRVVNL